MSGRGGEIDALIDDAYASSWTRAEPSRHPSDAPSGRASEAFAELYDPLLCIAREQLGIRAGQAADWLTASAHQALEDALRHRLAAVLDPIVTVDYRVFTSGTFSFLGGDPRCAQKFVHSMKAGGFRRLLHRYPGAQSLCTILLEQWVDATAEFLDRLDRDATSLSKTFDRNRPVRRVETLRAGMSDAHDGGRTVLGLTFDTGLRLVYKPRPLGLDAFFAAFLSWLNQSGRLLPLRPLDVLAKGGYGWIEHVEQAPCSGEADVRNFFVRTGQLTALIYAFNGHDFHEENLIACGDHPIPIDLEAILRPRFRLREEPSARGVNPWTHADLLGRSVLGTSLLPVLHVRDDTPLTISGLGVRPGRAANIKRRRSAGRINVCFTLEDGERTEHYAEDHVDAIVEGFRQAYEVLLDHRNTIVRDWLPRAAPCPVRFIFRNTSTYGKLIKQRIHPAVLRQREVPDALVTALSRALRDEETVNRGFSLLDEEVSAIDRLDVPSFSATAGSRDLVLQDGEVVSTFFEQSACAAAATQFARLSPHDGRLQSRLVATCLAAHSAPDLAPGLGDPAGSEHGLQRPATSRKVAVSAESAVSAARRLCDLLAEEAVVIDEWAPGENSVGWFGAKYCPRHRRYDVTLGNLDLVSGNGGIALFASALYAVDRYGPAGELAVSAAEGLRRGSRTIAEAIGGEKPLDLGIGTGVGALIYSLVHVARHLDDPTFLDDAQAIAGSLTPEVFVRSAAPDVLSGTAGSVLALLALHQATGDASLRARVEIGGESLLRSLAHRSDEEPIPSGAARGLSGIALALARLYRVTGRGAFRQALLRVLTVEDEASVPMRPGDVPCSTWTVGQAGRGLSRLAVLAVDDLPAAARRASLETVEAAVEGAGAHLLRGSDTLGCGRMGRVELLLVAGRRLDRPELVGRARRALSADRPTASEPGYKTDWGGDHRHAGLLHGLAGIGYQLLRTCHPDTLPSVLLWEAPVNCSTGKSK